MANDSEEASTSQSDQITFQFKPDPNSEFDSYFKRAEEDEVSLKQLQDTYTSKSSSNLQLNDTSPFSTQRTYRSHSSVDIYGTSILGSDYAALRERRFSSRAVLGDISCVSDQVSRNGRRRLSSQTVNAYLQSGKHPLIGDLRIPDPHEEGVRCYKVTGCGLIKVDSEEDDNSENDEHIAVIKIGKCEEDERSNFKILVLGSSGVGKRALIREFMMPDNFFKSCLSRDEDGEKCVSIRLDSEESTLEFIDLSDNEIDHFHTADHIDAYVVVYSVEDRKSFETAVDRLCDIRQDEGRDVAVILVANKTDLVRTRVVIDEEGKHAAQTYDCKYIEVSAAIDHKIDELLVGILKQIRLIKERHSAKSKRSRCHLLSPLQHIDGRSELCCPLSTNHGVFSKIFGKIKPTSKSCENLYVL